MAAFTNMSQIKSGMRVRCIYPHPRYGKECMVVHILPIEIAWDYGNDTETVWRFATSFEPADQLGISFGGTAPATNQVRQEKPCQGCGKLNDVGVRVCWCCGNQPF